MSPGITNSDPTNKVFDSLFTVVLGVLRGGVFFQGLCV